MAKTKAQKQAIAKRKATMAKTKEYKERMEEAWDASEAADTEHFSKLQDRPPTPWEADIEQGANIKPRYSSSMSPNQEVSRIAHPGSPRHPNWSGDSMQPQPTPDNTFGSDGNNEPMHWPNEKKMKRKQLPPQDPDFKLMNPPVDHWSKDTDSEEDEDPEKSLPAIKIEIKAYNPKMDDSLDDAILALHQKKKKKFIRTDVQKLHRKEGSDLLMHIKNNSERVIDDLASKKGINVDNSAFAKILMEYAQDCENLKSKNKRNKFNPAEAKDVIELD